MPSTYHLALRSAATQLSSSSQQMNISHLYDRVNDAYGPGVFAAWILVALSVVIQRFTLTEGRPYWNLDKDLVATVLYPVCVAGDLVRHVRQFPGPKGHLWDYVDRDTEFGPYMMEIRASRDVCLMALGLNVLFMALLSRSTKRVVMLAIATLWIAGALCYAAWYENWPFSIFIGLIGLVCPSILFCYIGITFRGTPYILILDLALFWHVLVRLSRLQFEGFWILLVFTFISFGFTAFAAWMVAYGSYFIYLFIFPGTAHTVFEIFQVSALGVGLINLIFSLHRDFRIWGPSYMGELRQVWANPMFISHTRNV